jgi:hypothetical protein
MAGKADAVNTTLARLTQEAAAQTVAGDITEQMAEVLTAARDNRVEVVGGRWVIDVSWWSRVAMRAHLAACDTDRNGRAVLKLTDAGRAMVTRIWAARVLADALRVANARRNGFQYAQQLADAEAAQRAEQRRRTRPGRALREAALWLFLIAVGYVLAAVTLRPAGR